MDVPWDPCRSRRILSALATRAQVAALFLACWLCLASARPEYRALIPNGFQVQWHGQRWPGVGHLAAQGGGKRNSFGQDFEAAGFKWTRELCRRDSDGDGWTNGQELGDPQCVWKPGAAPERTACVLHPGLPGDQVTERCTALLAAESTTPSQPSSEPAHPPPQGQVENRTAPVRPAMEVGPVNTAGHVGQQWCSERNGTRATQWHALRLPTTKLVAQSDVYTCFNFELPSAKSFADDLDLVEMAIDGDSAQFLHHVYVFQCDAGLKFPRAAALEPYMCMSHSGSLLASCNALWWGVVQPELCAPPGLVLANLGALRRAGKNIVVQVHWTFGPTLVGSTVSLANASVRLGFRPCDPQAPAPAQVGDWVGTAIYPNPRTGRFNSLVIPPRTSAHEASFSCSRHCSQVALRGGAAKPQKHVNVIGYGFHMHQYGARMTIRIKRCKNNYNGEQDVEWTVENYNTAASPIYALPSAGIKLYGGDSVTFTCTYNTSQSNATVVGGYHYTHNEMCLARLVYWPLVEHFNGCAATTTGESLCFHEMKATVKENEKHDDAFPIQALLSPYTTGPFPWSIGWKATWLLVMTFGITALLWMTHFVLKWCERLAGLGTPVSSSPITFTAPPAHPQATATRAGAWMARVRAGLADVGQRYTSQSPGQQRNVCTYVVHLLVDSVGLCWLGWLMLNELCLCGEPIMHMQSLQLSLTLLVALYTCELLWKPGMDWLLTAHHLATIGLIVAFGMEIEYLVWQSTDVLVVLGLFAYLEQPTFLALLMYRMAPGWRGLVATWTFACWFWVVSKAASLGLAIYLMVGHWPVMPTWVRGTYIALWGLMISLQGLSAQIQFKIRNRARARQARMRAATESTDRQETQDLDAVMAHDPSGFGPHSPGGSASSSGQGSASKMGMSNATALPRVVLVLDSAEPRDG